MLLLGKYESLGILGRGSMGQVHAARPRDDPATTVVVKVMRPDVADTPSARQSFDREIQSTTRLRHPYIVRVLEAGVDAAAGPCIVMEFVPGTTLEQVLRTEGRLHPTRVGWLAGCLCHALEAAHQAGVIHQDLKPANLMVVNAGTPQEHLKVMDFGLARLASKPHLSKEQFERAAYVRAQGTPAYISPEQLRGDAVDGRADLYTTGVILFEALTGQLPFPQNDIDRLIEAHLKAVPTRFSALGVDDVPAGVESIVHWCLCKYPAERPASARALAEKLGAALGTDVWADTAPEGTPEAEAAVPLADELPPQGPVVDDPNALVRMLEAWMPDRIAVIKLGGFLEDLGGKILNTQPGLVQAEFPPIGPPKPTGGFLNRLFGPVKPSGDALALDLNLDKPNPAEGRLVVTAVFHMPGGGRPTEPEFWNARCEHIYREMQKYLMAGR